MNEKKEQEEVYAHGGSIESSLKQLAERRTDIFGVGVEETQIGKKLFNDWNAIHTYHYIFLIDCLQNFCLFVYY